MSRILLTWELGLNLGHLTRLLPVAQRLKADGHIVLVATRDVQAAARVLGPAGIPFVQAPYLPKGIALAHRPAGYADILLSQGWSDGERSGAHHVGPLLGELRAPRVDWPQGEGPRILLATFDAEEAVVALFCNDQPRSTPIAASAMRAPERAHVQ